MALRPNQAQYRFRRWPAPDAGRWERDGPSPVVDDALLRARSEETPEGQVEAFLDVSSQLAQDIPYLPTRFSTYYLIGQPDVRALSSLEDIGLRSDLVWIAQ